MSQHTTADDDRVAELINTLKPVIYDDPQDQPRIPVRTQLISQLKALTDLPFGSDVETWVDHQFKVQERRDDAWRSLQDAMSALESVDEMEQKAFDIVIASLDTMAKQNNILLPTYTVPWTSWADDTTARNSWDDVAPFDYSWTDNTTAPPTDWTPPSPPISFREVIIETVNRDC